MPELLLELFSEEIPARMQARAAADLSRLLCDALAPLEPIAPRAFAGPRRIALVATIAAEQQASASIERGPRRTAPEGALAGFLRKHAAARDQLAEEGEFWVLHKRAAAIPASTLLGQAVPALLRRFPWPKSMRWGQGSAFTWVRPLRRILCLLDGAVVALDLVEPGDDGHALRAGDQTEGHRFHHPGPFRVASFADWEQGLRQRHVIADAAERRQVIEDGIAALAAAETLAVVRDDGLLDEVAGLVEWPVPLLGRIDPEFMDLPPEVMQVSMRVNQRYFALRHPDGTAAPRFAFAANIDAPDGGAAIVAGNERVLRARFSDARHFWDLDRRTRLDQRIHALDAITFHAKLGSQGDRVRRIAHLAVHMAPLVQANPTQATRAARLAKADLTTGMVGEFPELQGVMGGYYAQNDGEAQAVAEAISVHYAPKGPTDPVPTAPVAIAVALADKIDQLAAFFAIGEMPTGSGDPYALRRATLGVFRIIRVNRLRLKLFPIFVEAAAVVFAQRYYSAMSKSQDPIDALRVFGVPAQAVDDLVERLGTIVVPSYPGGLDFSGMTANTDPRSVKVVRDVAVNLLEFIADRLRVQLRAEGARHDVLAAIFAADQQDDIVRLLAQTDAVASFLRAGEGADLLAAARRAANILRIEDKKDGPHRGPVDPAQLVLDQEKSLDAALTRTEAELDTLLATEQFGPAMATLARLRPDLDAFFDDVTVNAPEPGLRQNRLRLLARVAASMHRTADFSRIEG